MLANVFDITSCFRLSLPCGGRPSRCGRSCRVSDRISIHALRGEGDDIFTQTASPAHQFQSTPSVGRATITPIANITMPPNFNPRPPWGGRLIAPAQLKLDVYFNPRPPWGGRPPQEPHSYTTPLFQSTPSVGRATLVCYVVSIISCVFQSTPSVGRATDIISASFSQRRHFNPRPPWGGRLPPLPVCRRAVRHFNPRPPWGGRRGTARDYALADLFQSTPSVGRATIFLLALFQILSISIHALRGEGDFANAGYRRGTHHFNPRPPWGGRLSQEFGINFSGTFQSTPSVGRATYLRFRLWHTKRDFNPRPPWGGRLCGCL